MSSVIALDALLKAVVARLKGVTAVYGDHVYLDIAEAGTPLPYVVIGFVGGGADGFKRNSATIQLQVKCIAGSRSDALAGAAAIQTALDYQGEQEGAGLTAGPGWTITTATDVGDISLTELYENVAPLFHNGKTYQFIMETN